MISSQHIGVECICAHGIAARLLMQTSIIDSKNESTNTFAGIHACSPLRSHPFAGSS